MTRSFFVSVSSEIIFDHRSIFHDKPNALKLCDICDGIAGNGDDVGEFSGFDGTTRSCQPNIAAAFVVIARITSSERKTRAARKLRRSAWLTITRRAVIAGRSFARWPKSAGART
jgi:hypothetical protein